MGFIGIVKIQFHLDACYLFLTKKHFQNCRDEYKILLWNTGITSPDIGGFIKEEKKKKISKAPGLPVTYMAALPEYLAIIYLAYTDKN